MSIGLSTYAYFWRHSSRAPKPMSLEAMIADTAAQGLELFQICDYPAIENYSAQELTQLREFSRSVGVQLELGTRGIAPEHLERFLLIAQTLEVTLVRSMLYSGDDRPTPQQAVDRLLAAMPAYEVAGVRLALETYEQVHSSVLVEIITAVDSPALGVCADPANCVANLELPAEVIARVAPWVTNLHVKDFAFSREEGWVGFSLTGAALGEGLLDYAAIIAALAPEDRGINRIVEHWLPWQGDFESTRALEETWTTQAVHYLRTH